jgi:hypothetical protein
MLARYQRGEIFMLRFSAVLMFLVIASNAAQARDGFEGVKCGADIPTALIGRIQSNEPVVATKGRHKALGLKDLGADEISDSLNAISWSICGSEYMMLVDGHSVVRDVVAVPVHSRRAPEFSGLCQVGGKEAPGVVVAILDNNAGTGSLLPAEAAWKIDETHIRFVKIPTHGLNCPRSGIIAADGGE